MNYGMNITKDNLNVQANLSNYNTTSSSKSNAAKDTTSTLISDYNSVKSSSYKKLLTAYYSKVNNGSIPIQDSSKDADPVQKKIKEDAGALHKAASKLSDNTSSSPFRRQEVTKVDSETGGKTVTRDYNKDAITDAVTTFVNAYNKTIDSVAKSDDNSILKNGVRMTQITKANRDSLSQVGITVNSKNKLEIDPEKLKKADVSTLKNLFSGSYSYADKVEQKSYQIEMKSNLELTKSRFLYQKDGSYIPFSSGDLMTSFV